MKPERKTAVLLAGVAVVMLSLSFAAVPFYNWFCRVTGYAGTTSVAAQRRGRSPGPDGEDPL